MKLIIEDDEGRKTVVPVVREEITIGRQDGNTIRLTERNVSRRHARLVKENGNLVIEDLGSYNGVRVNGEKINTPTAIKEGDLVEIGDYDLGIQGKFEAGAALKQSTIPPTSKAAVARPATMPPAQAPAPAAPPPPAAAPPPPAAQEAAPPPAPQISTPAPSAGGATAIIRVSDIMKSAPQGEVRDLQRQEMPSLVGLAGQFRGREFYLQRTEVKFGRTDENDIVVDHQSVSRNHAKFVLEDGQWKVFDNKSANGVHVNGDPYAVSNINPGDTIELGHVKFRFCAPGEKFKPPPEKTEEAKGGLKPTTAELIAGAQGRSPTPSASAKKSGPPIGLIAGVVVAVVVLGGGAFMFLGKGGKKSSNPDEMTGEDAVRAGDVQFKQHHYLEATKLYDQAGTTSAPNKKKAAEETKGEEEYREIKALLDSGDVDKAKQTYEKCATESTYFCQKAQTELADPVKAAFAKKHLAVANAAKASNDSAKCSSEVAAVLAFDPANAEAQALQSQCSPQEAAKPVAPKPAASGENKEAKAAKLAKSSASKLVAHDFQGAVNDAKGALAQSPADNQTQCLAYRSLGYGYAYLSDIDSAKKWLKQYKPCCTNDCAQVDAFINR
jgi:pSer/pThr/pTyr-binding forkhead associated (FHA) protein